MNMKQLPEAFKALAGYNQFIVWKEVPRNNGKIDKFPIDYRTGWKHDAHDPAIWLDVNTAIIKAQELKLGVGFVFTANDPFTFIDIDGAKKHTGDQWNPISIELCNRFAGGAMEISTSGTGIHIIVSGDIPPHSCETDGIGGLYSEKRFVALTGINAIGDATTDHTEQLKWLVSNYFPLKESCDITPQLSNNGPVPEWKGPDDDEELLKKMLNSKSAAGVFGDRATIQDLWTANEDKLGDFFPDPNGIRPFDWSKADAALMSHLAFWTGKDTARMDRLFRLSGLMRDKWDDRGEYYKGRTISLAVKNCNAVYGERKGTFGSGPIQPQPGISPAPVAAQHEIQLKNSYQLMSIDQQLNHFKGCVYVQHDNKILTPQGILLDQQRFNATYGGYVFIFDSNEGNTVKNAWEVFTNSQAVTFKKVNQVCFKPTLPPGEIIDEEGRTKVNIYTPIQTPRIKGDPTPFLNLVHRLFPVNKDREIILAYMAAIVQYPGVKFQWAPLVQGCQGNGKSFLTKAIAHAIGFRYTHKPPASDISNIFNKWVMGTLFAAVEEIYIGDQRHVMDALKTLITDDFVPITPKGVDQIMGDNFANFWCNTNHKDAIRIPKDDNRRWALFYTPHQSYSDIVADGMGGRYFPDLFAWARGGGFAIINDYLRTYEIPLELNPATEIGGLCHRAPITSSTEEAVIHSMGGVEQEILEAIGENRMGFSGGWISSIALNRLMVATKNDKRIPPNKRKDILRELGYIPHPGLKDGRSSGIISIDNGRPRLYIKVGHPHANFTEPSIIAKYYEEAQTGAGDSRIDANKIFGN